MMFSLCFLIVFVVFFQNLKGATLASLSFFTTKAQTNVGKTSRVFPARLANGEIFNFRLLFENNRLLFSL